MKQLAIIMNPCAGQKRANRFLYTIVREFYGSGYTSTVHLTMERGDGAMLAKKLAAQNDMLVCIGGDGTLSEVVSGVLASGARPQIGYIATGSTNDFATSIGLPRSVMGAARNCMMGTLRSIDIGSFNERSFVYVASFGAFTRTSYTTSQAAKNAFGHLAYLLESLKELPQIHPYHLRIETGKTVFDDNYIFGAFANSTSIGGVLSLKDTIVSMNDGKFEMLLIKHPQNSAQLNSIVAALNLRNFDCPFITFVSVNSAYITCSQETPWSLDGEFKKSDDNVSIKIVPKAIDLRLPEKQSAHLFSYRS